MTERPKSAATKPKQVSVIGHYEMDKNIGEGNFAKVKLAKHTITGQQVFFIQTRLPLKSLTRTNWTRQHPKSYLEK